MMKSHIVIVLVSWFCLVITVCSEESLDDVSITTTTSPEDVSPTDFVAVLKEQNLTDSENEIPIPNSPSNYREALVASLESEIANWTEPEELSKAYPYYLSGFDEEERPIWISELGKFDMRKIAEAGPEVVKTFDKYVRKACLRMVKSHTLRNKRGNHLVYLLDFEGLQFAQLASIPTVSYLLKLARDYRKLLEDHTSLVVIVNANYVTETLVNLVRPIFGRVLEIVEIHGNNKAKWLPQVLKHFPKDQIPEWYGGQQGYKPVQVYG